MADELAITGAEAVPVGQGHLFTAPDSVAAPKDGFADLPAATGPTPLLGKTTVSVATYRSKPWKWAAKDAVRRLLPSDRVANCMRSRTYLTRVADMGIAVCVGEGRSFFRGIQVCGSPWGCPTCAERIAAFRQIELDEYRTAWLEQGGRLLFVSYTVPHVITARLFLTLDKLSKVDKKVKQDMAYKKLMKRMGYVAAVFATEVTYGRNGWHPHRHGIFFIDDEQITAHDVQEALIEIWIRKLRAFGLSAAKEDAVFQHGISVTDSSERLVEYITKYGQLPKWDESKELTLGMLKQGRGESVTAWGLLDMYMRGDTNAGDLFVEYATVMEGRRQLVKTPGLAQKIHAAAVEVTDDEAAAVEPKEAEVVTVLTMQEWEDVCAAGLRGEVLEAALLSGASGVRQVVAEARARRGIWTCGSEELAV